LEAFTPKRKTDVDRRPHILAYIHLGLRKAELYKILPEHVNLQKGTVWIEATKTEKSPRLLPLTPELGRLFKRMLQDAPRGVPLFAPWNESACDRQLKEACKRAKVPRCSFGDLRRTFCSLLANAQVSLQHCAKLMGHSSLDMVMRVYAKISSESLQSAISCLPALSYDTVTDGVTLRARKTSNRALPATGTES
jgi:integrase